MKAARALKASLLLALPLAALAGGGAHVHGLAKLDVAVDGHRITLHLSTPLDNLVGFERAPRNDAERRRVDAAVARLRDGDRLFAFDAAAGCRMSDVTLDSPVLGLGGTPAGAAKGGHAELHASWDFDCRDAAQAAQVQVGLFAFAALQRVQVQLALPKTQFKRELKRPDGRLSLRP